MVDEQYRESIEACHACASACRQLAATEASDARRDISGAIERLRHECDCLDICRLTAEWLEQGSRFAPLLCEVCAIVCNACGDELALRKEAYFVSCAETCHRCAEACRRLVGGAIPEAATSIGME